MNRLTWVSFQEKKPEWFGLQLELLEFLAVVAHILESTSQAVIHIEGLRSSRWLSGEARDDHRVHSIAARLQTLNCHELLGMSYVDSYSDILSSKITVRTDHGNTVVKQPHRLLNMNRDFSVFTQNISTSEFNLSRVRREQSVRWFDDWHSKRMQLLLYYDCDKDYSCCCTMTLRLAGPADTSRSWWVRIGSNASRLLMRPSRYDLILQPGLLVFSWLPWL